MVLIQFNRYEVKSVEEKTKEDDKGVSTTYTYKLEGGRATVTIKTEEEIPEFEQGKLIDVHAGDGLMKKLEDFDGACSEEEKPAGEEDRNEVEAMVTLLKIIQEHPGNGEKIAEIFSEATPLWSRDERSALLTKAEEENYIDDEYAVISTHGKMFLEQHQEDDDCQDCTEDSPCEEHMALKHHRPPDYSGPAINKENDDKIKAKRDEKAAEFEASENVQAILKGKCSDDSYNATIPNLLNAELQYCLMQEKRKGGRKKLIKEAKDREATFTNMTETLEG